MCLKLTEFQEKVKTTTIIFADSKRSLSVINRISRQKFVSINEVGMDTFGFDIQDNNDLRNVPIM